MKCYVMNCKHNRSGYCMVDTHNVCILANGKCGTMEKPLEPIKLDRYVCHKTK